MLALKRNPAVTTTEIEGEFFLVEPDSGEIFYLDAVTSGVWRLVETPCGEPEILETLSAAFPDAPADQLRGDVARLLEQLRRARLILPA
ncbi:MAG: PqqD family protein [Tistlia sp.]|uniref:PqqD family protein n=1 Tax=Tistlia sp. TaxID=3057121 RepID=UPI0034A3853C